MSNLRNGTNSHCSFRKYFEKIYFFLGPVILRTPGVRRRTPRTPDGPLFFLVIYGPHIIFWKLFSSCHDVVVKQLVCCCKIHGVRHNRVKYGPLIQFFKNIHYLYHPVLWLTTALLLNSLEKKSFIWAYYGLCLMITTISLQLWCYLHVCTYSCAHKLKNKCQR